MTTTLQNYAVNLLKLLRGDRVLRPLIVTYYVTTQCNLNCTYCEYFGARRNAEAEKPLALAEALRVLAVIRGGSDRLLLTGGEPLLQPDIDRLILRAKSELKFRHITLLTNGRLLPQHEAMLPALDRLVISLDATDATVWSHMIGVAPAIAQEILDNIAAYAARQKEFGYRSIVNCVLTPETLPGAQSVLDFCIEHHILISFSPQSVDNWPRYDLLVSETYRNFIHHLIVLKQKGAPILGSAAYLRTLIDFAPYACYPLLVPRVMPNGDLVYPCRPIEQSGNTHGGRTCNLLEAGSWERAVALSVDDYGSPPQTCASCYQQCFAEPSLMQARPLSLLREWLWHSASRRGSVWTHAPG